MKKVIFFTVLCLNVMVLSVVPCIADTNTVPLRQTFENMGMEVEWSAPDNIVVKNGDCDMSFKVGSDVITTEEGEFYMEQAVRLEKNTTYIAENTVDLVKNLSLYHNAIVDAVQVEEQERLPLQSIDIAQEKVLVCTWNRYPESYVTGSEITLKYGDVWVFLADEVIKWGQQNGMAEDMVLRMEQLIGLPPQKGNTHFSMLWVNPKDLYRPSPDNEIDDNIAELDFPENATEEYKQWFDGNKKYSYEPHKYPWTRLGYTYDWSDNSTEYGLSEFIIKDGSKVVVEKTYSNEEFFEYITSSKENSINEGDSINE